MYSEVYRQSMWISNRKAAREYTARELARETPTINAAREYTARELAREFHKLFSPSM